MPYLFKNSSQSMPASSPGLVHKLKFQVSDIIFKVFKLEFKRI